MTTLPDQLTVEVTQEDIDNGIACEAHQCAIAVAVGRIPGVEAVTVGLDLLNVQVRDDEGVSYVVNYVLPDEGNEFIYRFDNGHAVEPVTFTATRAV